MESGGERLRAARQHGEEDAQRAEQHAPTDVLERVAWAVGFGKVDQLQSAGDQARDAGMAWRQIAEAIAEHWRNVRTKHGGGRPRPRAYRARKRTASGGS